MIKAWHGMIGNLRAWPMEANRSDSEDSPRDKMAKVGELEKLYKMGNGADIRSASLIDLDNWNNWWLASPDTKSKGRRYLTKDSQKAVGYRQAWAFVQASSERTLNIYEEWYDGLEIIKLFGAGNRN